jgi:hypothetical protein
MSEQLFYSPILGQISGDIFDRHRDSWLPWILVKLKLLRSVVLQLLRLSEGPAVPSFE